MFFYVQCIHINAMAIGSILRQYLVLA